MERCFLQILPVALLPCVTNRNLIDPAGVEIVDAQHG